MGICINCKHHSVSNEATEKSMYLYHQSHFCTNENYVETDYITGVKKNADCYKKNKFGECPYYENINGEETTEDTPATEETDLETTETLGEF